jgi:hypothetical protein
MPAQRPPATPSGTWVAAQVYVLDRVRIEVALEQRARYRYVRPQVLPMDEDESRGWRIVSPNCSRSIDRQGGVIDIAWLQPVPDTAEDTPGAWLLHARDHQRQCWVPPRRAASLPDALERLCADPLREFWQ